MDEHRDQGPTRTRAPDGRYVNFFDVGHNALEFLLDFGQFHPEDSEVRLHTRIVTGPVYAKLLASMLQRSIERYEADHGPIEKLSDDIDPLEMVKESIAGYERLDPSRNG